MIFSRVGVLPLRRCCVCRAGNAGGIPTTESEGVKLAWRIVIIVYFGQLCWLFGGQYDPAVSLIIEPARWRFRLKFNRDELLCQIMGKHIEVVNALS